MFKTNIEQKTLNNQNYRKVLYTTNDLQLVIMSLQPREEIGEEVHDGSQFIRVEEGVGRAVVEGKTYQLRDGISIVIDAGVRHNIIAGKEGMKLYSIYSPPQHRDGVVERFKQEE
jgi:mannose-6-phosphate isomerase-like protein (cupin superfamily)